eukprot:3982978-Prymnesium_polylepis.1
MSQHAKEATLHGDAVVNRPPITNKNTHHHQGGWTPIRARVKSGRTDTVSASLLGGFDFGPGSCQ